MKTTRRIIQINEALCNGCGQCVPACAEGTLAIIDGKAKVVSDNLCDGLGACLGECPTGALTLVEREAAEFDPAAVEQRLAELAAQQEENPKPGKMACGCPSTQIMAFAPGEARCDGPAPTSTLTHWPVKIRLVPDNAPFLNNADVLVLADCAAAAHPDLHQQLIRERVVMMGCPKFDDANEYVDKLARICRNAGIRRLTAVRMEVPCCSGLSTIVQKARAASGISLPIAEIVIDQRGVITEKRNL